LTCNAATVSKQLCHRPGGTTGACEPCAEAGKSAQCCRRAPLATEPSGCASRWEKAGSDCVRHGPFRQDAAIPAGGKQDWVISCPRQSFCQNNSNVLINSALSSVPAALVKTLFLQLTESKQALKTKTMLLQAQLKIAICVDLV